MQFLKTLSLVLPALCLAAPAPVADPAALVKRADLSSQIVTGIQGLQNASIALNNTLNSFRPNAVLGLAKALQIQKQTNALSTKIVDLTNVGKASDNFSSDGSTQIATTFVQFSPVIQSLLQNLVAHKPAFATAFLFVGDLSKTVQADLIKLRTQTNDSFNAIVPKLAPPFDGLAGLVTAPIDEAFANAINKYATCSGLLCLPDASPLLGGGK